MSTQPNTDPFAGGESNPSVSFKDKPVGTTYHLDVLEAPKLVQARDYETGKPAFYDDGNPKMTVVTTVVNVETGEQLGLWAPKPSAMFAAIAAASRQAGAQVAPGGRLVVTYSGDKADPSNPRKAPQKLYTVQYTAPNAFGEQAPAQAAPQPVRPVQPVPVAPAVQYPPQPAFVPAPAAPQYTEEQIAAARAAGIPLPGITA